jgi:bifunctional non-homologous end joining protein LigD
VSEMKRPSGFIEPCLPSLAERPPSGSGWIHEIKHDGFRLLACRGAAAVRLLTRNGNDFTARYPLIVETVGALPQSCVIDGEAVVCDGRSSRNCAGVTRTATCSCGRSTSSS